jgi:hypothetical protein
MTVALAAQRDRLPNRRPAEHVSFRHGNADYVASIGCYEDGRIGEVFLRCKKAGTDLDVIARDSSTLFSLLCQYGCPLETVARALTRNDDNTPSGPLGRLLDIIAGEQPPI